MHESGNEPENFLPEYGENQYEITCRPSLGVKSADRAVNIREITYEIAHQLGLCASFTPQDSPESVSNGVHLHLSFLDSENQPVLYSSDSEQPLSEQGLHWCAGVLHYMPALCAFSVPSPVSYLRLKPSNWSSAFGCLGLSNREAALRICPPIDLGGKPQGHQLNLEYRVLDATASPHLAMAAILIAGRLGIEKRIPLKARIDQDPSTLSEFERKELGIQELPESLSDAMASLEKNSEFLESFPKELMTSYFSLKNQEIKNTNGMDGESLCEQYKSVY